MDDVLDNICTFYYSWSDYWHLSVLVRTWLLWSFPIVRTYSYFYFCWCKWQFDVGVNHHDTWAYDCILLSFIVFWRLPFYYELKIAFVVWLLSPYTKGSSVLYRKFVHPTLSSKEKVMYLDPFFSFLQFILTLSRLKKYQ